MSFLLQETLDNLLLETGDNILLDDTFNILNFTGFEEGTNNNQGNGYHDTNPFAGTEATYDTVTVRTGTYSMKVAKVGAAIGSMRFPCKIQTDGRTDTNDGSYANLYMQFAFRYSSKPASASEDIAYVEDINSRVMHLRIDSAGKLSLYAANGTTQIGSTGATILSANTWYVIRLYLGTGTSAQYNLYIDGVLELSGTTSTPDNKRLVGLGCVADRNTADYTAYFDDLIVTSNDFPDLTSAVKVIKPTANGSTQTWTAGTNSSDYAEVDEIPRDDGTVDYCMTPSNGTNPNVGLFAMQDCATVGITGTILALKARIITIENAANSSATKIRVKSGVTTSESTTLNGSTSLQGRQRLLILNPDTSTAWTTTTVDAVEVGAVEDNNVAVRLTNVMAYILYVPSTSVDYPIVISQGSFTLTGQSAALKIGRKIIAAYAAFTLTGQNALLKLGKGMQAVYGSFTLTGQNAILRIAMRMIAAQGSFTQTMQTVIMRYGRTMVAGFETFVLTGQTALLKLGWKITAAQGSFSLTGQDILLKIGKYMAAAVGSFVLTGQDILLKLGWKMAAAYTTFTLAGQDILLKVGRNIVAAYGAFTLTGQDILFHIAMRMQAVYGQITLTGQTVLFAVNGLYVRWTTAVKNAVATLANRAKNSSTWTNRDKTL